MTVPERMNDPEVRTAVDGKKDQTYFLSLVPAEAFRGVVFPLAHLRKNDPGGAEGGKKRGATRAATDVAGVGIGERDGGPIPPPNPPVSPIPYGPSPHTTRSLALSYSLPSAHTKDSFGLCFLPLTSFPAFVSENLPTPANRGRYVDVDTGGTVGTFVVDQERNPEFNPGIFTIGQAVRHGGMKCRHFVVDRRVERCKEGSPEGDVLVVTVCNDTNHPSLYVTTFHLPTVNWFPPPSLPSGENGAGEWRGLCRVRHGQPLCKCVAVSSGSGWRVTVEKPMRAVTSGQVCALYSTLGNRLSGGGVIGEVGETFFERGEKVEGGWMSGGNDRGGGVEEAWREVEGERGEGGGVT